MRAANQPEATNLDINNKEEGRIDDIIAASTGDPAYLHEYGHVLSGFTRKQIEKSIRRLLALGRIVSFGRSTRRLYASPRMIPERLAELSAAEIRLLQYAPMKGAFDVGILEEMTAGAGTRIDALEEAGFLRILPGRRRIAILSSSSRQLRAVLGEGIALQSLTTSQIIDYGGEIGILMDRLLDEEVDLNDLGKYTKNPTRMSEDDRLSVSGGRVNLSKRGRRIATDRRQAILDIQDEGIAMKQQANKPANKVSSAGSLIETNEVDRKMTAYLLLRTDLPSFGTRKARENALHAGAQMTRDLLANPYREGRDPRPGVEAWHDGQMGNAIPLNGGIPITANEIERTVEAARKLGHEAGIVIKDEYDFIVNDEILPLLRPEIMSRPAEKVKAGWRCFRREITAGWILGNASELEIILSRFDLTPNTPSRREK